jgi:hypothetical protein
LKKNILLVGCGNIGVRHLQALLKIQKNLNINIVEPNINSQKLAKSIIYKEKINIPSTINWFQNIFEIKNKNDLVIIATNSKGRYDLISTLLEQGHKRFIVEKMVCQSNSEYLKLLSKSKKNNAKFWVNTPRRYFESYQKIKNFFTTKELFLTVDAGNIGLGSNAIHMLDLFCWFIDDYDIILNGDLLDDKILLNKRGDDFVEFSGTIVGQSKNGMSISITFHANQNIPLTLSFIGQNMKIILNETDSKLLFTNTKKKFNFKTNFVSSITNTIAQDILKKDSCLLPTLENSYYVHSQLFKIFNKHLKKSNHIKSKFCPIT